jgi:hypothetical protein
MNFWVPPNKFQLVNWLVQRYPVDKSRFDRMGKKQLYAIYYSEMKKSLDK